MVFPGLKEIGQLEEILRTFLRKRERVLLCFPKTGEPVGQALAGMVERCGAVPVFWEPDLRWKTLLRLGFQHRCGTVIGAPGVVLGLSKLVGRAGTPLYIRSAVLIGGEPEEALRNNIRVGLDCEVRAWIGTGPDLTRDDRSSELLRELRRWTTILDCRLERMGPGLSLEMVIFPGEKLPKLPSFARLVIREWDPHADEPFDIPLQWKNGVFSSGNH